MKDLITAFKNSLPFAARGANDRPRTSAEIHHGRHTAVIEGDFVVFIIGMRVNHLWKVHTWLPVLLAMAPMLSELRQSDIKGMLNAEFALAGRTVVIVQHWRSYDALEQFAKDGDDLHLPAWREYNRTVAASGDVGVYHETYKVSAGDYEAVYANMPAFGLALAGEHVPVSRVGETSRERIGKPPAN